MDVLRFVVEAYGKVIGYVVLTAFFVKFMFILCFIALCSFKKEFQPVERLIHL